MINAPLFSRPSKGSPVSILTPAITSVSPSLTLAEPFAFLITSVSITSCLVSLKSLPSSRFPLDKASHICCLRRCSTIIVDLFDELIVFPPLVQFHCQSTFASMLAFGSHRPSCTHQLPCQGIHQTAQAQVCRLAAIALLVLA